MPTRMSRRDTLRLSAGLAAGGIFLSNSEAGAQSQSASDNRAESPSPSSLGAAASLLDIEAAAKAQISPTLYELISGGGGDGNTVRWNREAYGRIRLKPRVLVDVSKIDTRIELFGMKLPFPILLAPTGGHRLFHPQGELATVQGAGAASAAAVISSASTFPIEDIGKAATSPILLQLFIKPDRAFTKELVQRGEAAGCKAICVTVDDPITGVRDWGPRDLATLPRYERLNGAGASSAKFDLPGTRYSSITPDKVTWEGVDWLHSFARLPVLLKGVLNPDDADRAVRAGVAGLIVSNHGGRQLDTVPATVDALPLVADKVQGRIPVLLDGGIRRGTDVLKGLALGASAVLIGRPYVFGLTVAGAEGVTRAVNLLRAEFEDAMALAGRPTIQSIDRSALWQS
jgi:4-hydroxymandelate oxidase